VTQAAQALDRVQLFSLEQDARRHAERLARRAQFLADLTTTLAAARDVEALARKLGERCVSELADWSLVELAPPLAPRRIVSVRDATKRAAAAALERYAGNPQSDVRTREPILVTDVTSADVEGRAVDPRNAALARELGIRSYMVVPLAARGRVLGSLSFVTAGATPYDEQALLFAQEIAARGALTLDNLYLHDLEREAREAAERTTAELSVAHDTRERILGIVGHDLQNPLSAVALGAEVLLRTELNEHQTKVAQRIELSAGRMQRMTARLLTFARLRHGEGLLIERQDTDLVVVARHVLEELEMAHPQRKFELRPHGDTRGLYDPDLLAEMLSNLVGNAVQHGTPAPIVVNVTGDLQGVTMAVHNVGPPIPPALLPHLFQPFRGGAARDARSQHLGLGLYIAHHIVAQHGGELSVCSPDGDGTTFTARMPRLSAAAAS
jgi:signal transduction histidine kinase